MKQITINQTPALPGGEPSRYVTEKFFLRSGDDYNCPPLLAGQVVELSDKEADSLLAASQGFIIETTKKPTRSLVDLAAFQAEHPDPAIPGEPQPQSELADLVAKLSQQVAAQTDEMAAQARELRANVERSATLEARLEAALQDAPEEAEAEVLEEIPSVVLPVPAPQEIPTVVLPVPQSIKRTRRVEE